MKIPSSLLGAAILGSGITWLGIAAAAAGWRWTSQTFVGPAWGHAWLYTNMALAMSLFVLLPFMVTNGPTAKGENRRVCLISHCLVLLLAAIPILTTAGWISRITFSTVISVSVVQLAFAIFTLGLSAWISTRNTIGGVFSSAAVVGLFLLPPAIALIQASTFPWLTGGVWSNWIRVFPATMITAVCEHPAYLPNILWIAGMYAIIGALILFSNPRSRST